MAISVYQPLVGKDNQDRPTSEEDYGKMTKPLQEPILVGGITTTLSDDNHETLAIKIIIPPKPKGMNPGPSSSNDCGNSNLFVVSTFPVIQSDNRSNVMLNNHHADTYSSQSKIDVRSLFGHDEDLAASKLPFVWKLYEMLEDVETNGQEDVVSWIDDGSGFKVHHMQTFVDVIIPRYFRQSKYKSFQRQLYFYDFHRVSSGPDVGAYKHPQFLKGVKTLCLSMMPKKTSRRRSLKHKDLERMVPEAAISSHESMMKNESFEGATADHSGEWMMDDRECQIDSVKSFATESLHPQDVCVSSGFALHVEGAMAATTAPGDGENVSIFGNKSFHFLEIAFNDIYPPTEPPTTELASCTNRP